MDRNHLPQVSENLGPFGSGQLAKELDYLFAIGHD
jgi:hypothetical protein